MSEEITTTSWLTRLKDALIGILMGFALIIGAIVLIFWNEGHSLHMAQSLDQAKKVLISVPSSPLSNQNNLKVVYLNGLATTNDKLADSLLGIAVIAINLDRTVQMYQWEEKTETKTEKQLGGSEKQIKTYTYNKVWSDKLIHSSKFKEQEGHQNPSTMAIPSQQQYARTVTVGDFLLPDTLIKQIDIRQPVSLAQVNKESLKSQVNKSVSLDNDNELYLGQDPKKPEPGDLRIKVTAVYPQEVSIIGQQNRNTLQAYLAPAGENVLLLSTGSQSPDQMIGEALSQNKLLAWVLRLVSLIMLIGGFSLILNPLVVLADVLPLLGTIIGYGTGFIAFLCGISVWIIVTAIAWFTTRPLMSIALLLILVIGGYGVIKMRGNKAAEPIENKADGTQ